GLAVEIVADPGPVRVGVGDALEALAWYAFAYGGVDADLGAGRHDAGRRYREARIERLRASAGNDDDVAVALHAGGDRPLDVGRVEDVDVVVHDHHVLQIHHRQRGEERVLSLAGLLADGDDGVPERAGAERHVDVLYLHARRLERAPDGGVAR